MIYSNAAVPQSRQVSCANLLVIALNLVLLIEFQVIQQFLSTTHPFIISLTAIMTPIFSYPLVVYFVSEPCSH